MASVILCVRAMALLMSCAVYSLSAESILKEWNPSLAGIPWRARLGRLGVAAAEERRGAGAAADDALADDRGPDLGAVKEAAERHAFLERAAQRIEVDDGDLLLGSLAM